MNSKSLILACVIASSSIMASAADAVATATTAAPAATASAPASIAEEIATLSAEPSLKGVLEKFSLETSVGFESEYVFRGRSVTGPSINPAADIGYDIGNGFALAAGYWGNYNVSDSANACSENDFTVGLAYTIENVTVEFGYLAYTYTSSETTHEFNVGVSYDTTDLLGDFNVSPYIAGYYDITLSGKTLEGGLAYSAPVTKWLMGSTWGTIDFGAYLGYTYGDISCDDTGASIYDGYCYAGFSVGGTVAFTDFCSLSAGMRYAYCNNYTEDGPTNSRVWFGTALTFGF